MALREETTQRTQEDFRNFCTKKIINNFLLSKKIKFNFSTTKTEVVCLLIKKKRGVVQNFISIRSIISFNRQQLTKTRIYVVTIVP